MARANGKIIWIGEHACLYGSPAIVSDVPLSIEVSSGDLMFEDVEFVAQYLKVEPVGVEVQGDLPMGCGLGYSSALLTALYDFFSERNGLDIDFDDRLKCINEFEKFGSGLDAFGVNHEGVYFWSNGDTQQLDDIFFDYFLVNTGCEDTTEEMIKHVSMVDGFEECAINFRQGLAYSDIGLIASSIINCQELLEKIGAVDERANELINWLGEEGFAAKITGAGGKTNGSGVVVGIGRLNDTQRSTLSNDFGFEVIYET